MIVREVFLANELFDLLSLGNAFGVRRNLLLLVLGSSGEKSDAT